MEKNPYSSCGIFSDKCKDTAAAVFGGVGWWESSTWDNTIFADPVGTDFTLDFFFFFTFCA